MPAIIKLPYTFIKWVYETKKIYTGQKASQTYGYGTTFRYECLPSIQKVDSISLTIIFQQHIPLNESTKCRFHATYKITYVDGSVNTYEGGYWSSYTEGEHRFSDFRVIDISRSTPKFIDVITTCNGYTWEAGLYIDSYWRKV